MVHSFNKCLWGNFGASIQMLGNAIAHAPERMWQPGTKFYFMAYHTVVFLEYYLTQPVALYSPMFPYKLVDVENIPKEGIDDVLPGRFYNQQEIIEGLAGISLKCKKLILNASEETLNSPWITPEEIGLHGLCPGIAEDYTLLEILFYNLRHVQHHTAQLNLLLRQQTNTAPDWVSLVE